MNIELKDALEARLLFFAHASKQDQIPGVMDQIEKAELVGRAKELKLVLDLLNGKIKIA